MWKKLAAVGHTLPYDIRILGDRYSGRPLPEGRWADAAQPTLVMDGAKSPRSMRSAMAALAANLPNAIHRSLPGQTHMLKPEAVAPILVDFFTN